MAVEHQLALEDARSVVSIIMKGVDRVQVLLWSQGLQVDI